MNNHNIAAEVHSGGAQRIRQAVLGSPGQGGDGLQAAASAASSRLWYTVRRQPGRRVRRAGRE
jgi:hypothetical protein